MSVCWLIICMVEDCTNCTDILTGKYPDTSQNPCNLPKICNFFREPAIFWKESVQISSKFVQFKKSGHNPYTFKSPYTYNFLIIRFRFLVLTRFFVVCRFCVQGFRIVLIFCVLRICTIFFFKISLATLHLLSQPALISQKSGKLLFHAPVGALIVTFTAPSKNKGKTDLARILNQLCTCISSLLEYY